MDYVVHLAILFTIYTLLAFGFNLAVGMTGLINIGYVGLMGIGAYTSAILSKTYDWPFALSLAAGAVLASLIGALLALPARKIKGDYYALVTLGFLFIVNAVLINWDEVTRGTLGIPGVPRGMFAHNNEYLVLVVVLTVIAYFVLQRLCQSPFGRALEAVRDDEEVAESLGKPIQKLKIIAMAGCGLVAGLGGALLGHYLQFIAPGSFWLDQLVWILAAMMVGGMASMPGMIAGNFVLLLITEPLRYLSLPSVIIGPGRLMLFLLLLIVVTIHHPKGLFGRAQLQD